ncbi:hypothetical protein [Noviherbaspirillum humi]|nr:hypothetical protein [Noviherbaspirillum humi]
MKIIAERMPAPGKAAETKPPPKPGGDNPEQETSHENLPLR